MDIFSAATLLFLTMDPLGNVPIFISTLQDLPPERRTRVIIRELLLALGIMVLFLFFGQYLLKVMHLSQESISIAGGIILFLIALKMVFPVTRTAEEEDELHGEPLLVPLAIPLVAGPSALAMVLLLATGHPGRMGEWTIALLAAWAVTALILVSSNQLQKWLGKRGLIAVERLMGMLLVALSVEMFLDGITDYLGV